MNYKQLPFFYRHNNINNRHFVIIIIIILIIGIIDGSILHRSKDNNINVISTITTLITTTHSIGVHVGSTPAPLQKSIETISTSTTTPLHSTIGDVGFQGAKYDDADDYDSDMVDDDGYFDRDNEEFKSSDSSNDFRSSKKSPYNNNNDDNYNYNSDNSNNNDNNRMRKGMSSKEAVITPSDVSTKLKGADVIRKNLSPNLDEQISKMFEMKMMQRPQHDNNNNNNNNSNTNNSNNNNINKSNSKNKNKHGKSDDNFQANDDHKSLEEDPILEKIFSINWKNQDNNNNINNNNKNVHTSLTTTSATPPDDKLHYSDDISTITRDKNAPGNDALSVIQQQNHHHRHQHRQQQQQDTSSKYDQLQKQLIDIKSSDHQDRRMSKSTIDSPPGVLLHPTPIQNHPQYIHHRHHHTNNPDDHTSSDNQRRSPVSPAKGRLKRRLPHAIIIGVKKAGTRALLEFLRRHPTVRGAGPEVHFFDKNYHRGLHWYRSKMPPSLEKHLTIEKTPGYYINKMAPKRMFSMNNETKLLLVVRNPVNRLISQYAQRHSRKPNMSKFEMTVMRNYPHTKSMVVDDNKESVQQGLYAKYLFRWLRYFPLEQIAIIDGENLVLNPYEEIAKVENFLELPSFFTPDHFVANASRGFPCFRSVRQRLDEDDDGCSSIDRSLSPGQRNLCEDLGLDEYGDNDNDDEEINEEFLENENERDEEEFKITISTIKTKPRKFLQKDFPAVVTTPSPLSFGNAYHLLSLPNASMYFPNQMVIPSSLSSPPLKQFHQSSSSLSSRSMRRIKKRDDDNDHHRRRHHHRHLDRSRGIRKNHRSHESFEEDDGEEPITEQHKEHHHHHQRPLKQQQQRPNRLQSRKQQQNNKKRKFITTTTPTTIASNATRRLYCLNEGKGRVHPKVDENVMTLLENFYKPHNEKFFRLVGRRFDWS